MKTNKEVIDALTKYFITQDKETVARCLASMIIDFNRIFHLQTLPEEEKALLNARVIANVLSLRKFIKNGPEGDIKLYKWNSGE
jgi:hypothetical protein